jgi:hypothetical protein
VTNNLLTESMSAPLGGATAATIDVSSGMSNLTIDALPRGEQVLASGSLQYYEKQGTPIQFVRSEHGRAVLTLRERDLTQRPWFRLPGTPALDAQTGRST